MGDIAGKKRDCTCGRFESLAAERYFQFAFDEFENFILAGVDMERDAACWGSDAFEKKVIATCFGAAQFDGDLLANDDEFASLAGLQECGFVVSSIHKVFSAIFMILSAALVKTS